MVVVGAPLSPGVTTCPACPGSPSLCLSPIHYTYEVL